MSGKYKNANAQCNPCLGTAFYTEINRVQAYISFEEEWFLRHRTLFVPLLALVLTALASPLAAAVDLTVWVQSDIRREQFQFITDWYRQENPNVNIDLQQITGSQAEFTQKLTLAIASGAPPDVTWLEGSTVIEFAAQGLLTDLTRVLEDLRFTPADTQEMTYKGRIWAVPYHTTSRGLLKRVDLFNAAGLDPEAEATSLDDLWRWNQVLTVMNPDGSYARVGIIPWVGNWGAPAWMWTFGGTLLDETGLRPTATHPKNIEAFEWLLEWGELYGNRAPVTGGYTGFATGTIAMVTESTTSAGRAMMDGLEFTTGRVPHPPGGANGTWGGGQAVGVPSNAPNMDEAIKLARYFGLDRVQERRFRTSPEAFPAAWDALQAIVPDLPPAYQSLLAQLPEARPRTPLWIDYYVNNLTPRLNDVIAGRITPQQALQQVQQVMEVRFAEVFGND